jgi:hypothetical protein
MCELLERKDRRAAIPYESDADKTDEEIVDGLMEITALSLTDLLADEPAYECSLMAGVLEGMRDESGYKSLGN